MDRKRGAASSRRKKEEMEEKKHKPGREEGKPVKKKSSRRQTYVSSRSSSVSAYPRSRYRWQNQGTGSIWCGSTACSPAAIWASCAAGFLHALFLQACSSKAGPPEQHRSINEAQKSRRRGTNERFCSIPYAWTDSACTWSRTPPQWWHEFRLYRALGPSLYVLQ